jgi:NitT/TauT family transport system substrate-binding protein
MLGTCRFLPSALLLAVAALPSASVAQQPTKATIVQMHAVIGVGEEVFLYAVPKQLGYFQAEGLDVGIQGAQSGTVSAQVIQSGGAQLGTTRSIRSSRTPARSWWCCRIRRSNGSKT